MKSPAVIVALCFLSAANLFADIDVYRAANIQPPAVPREFRAAWISEVASNADWPSKPGLSVADQKTEMISLLDHAVQLHLNAVIFQVRPASDALYASPYEPWSELLTGAQGRPPQPFYDPLAFAIDEAHKRGLELHAWINPFRAMLPTAKSAPAGNHISRTHPEFIRHYGEQTWLDPGNPAVRNYVLTVVMDIVKRYDVDGVQFDDYFYPYPQSDANDHPMDFPDYETWKKFGAPLHLSLDDWRRANVNKFIYGAYTMIKAQKPWVKVGVSPFGIWRPGYPPQIKGLDSYAKLYSDSRLWLANGWVDYLSPQLYWSIEARQQSFPVLLNWWEEQNIKGRGLWPGLGAAYVGGSLTATDVERQLQVLRGTPGVDGEIFFHLNNLVNNQDLYSYLRAANTNAAIVPAMPWLSTSVPSQPTIYVATNTPGALTFNWQTADATPKIWLLQYVGTNDVWMAQIYPANQGGCTFSKSHPNVIAISAVDLYGNISAPAVLRKIVVPTSRHSYKGMIINVN
ncbi:MAG TPA: family 10 glycosylhydrolase [Verrucomicrobiae bacterium]|jgi:uncharacterized lipoprotein YddW (UPF0748 family)